MQKIKIFDEAQLPNTVSAGASIWQLALHPHPEYAKNPAVQLSQTARTGWYQYIVLPVLGRYSSNTYSYTCWVSTPVIHIPTRAGSVLQLLQYYVHIPNRAGSVLQYYIFLPVLGRYSSITYSYPCWVGTPVLHIPCCRGAFRQERTTGAKHFVALFNC